MKRCNKFRNLPNLKIYHFEHVNPIIPEGYKYLYGEWNNGFTIERIEDGSQFVWIPVNSLPANGTLDNKHFSETFGRRNYHDNEFSKDEYHEDITKEFLEQVRSVKKYGGFYISRYNVSRNAETGAPQSIKGAKPWVNITFRDAKKVSTLLENSKAVKSHLTYGSEYDSILEWFIASHARTLDEIAEDSTKWGNYFNANNSNGEIYKTGSSEKYCTNNIYDFAGNIDEYTQEKNYILFCTVRGGSCWDFGIDRPVALRYMGDLAARYKNTGFRVALWIK